MAPSDVILTNRKLRMEGSYPAQDIFLKSARVIEKVSRLTETRVEFLARDKALQLEEVVGYDVNIVLEPDKDKKRTFRGLCISAEYIGLYEGFGHFIAEVRPWLWFLTQEREIRIFQDMDVKQIIKKVIADHGYSSRVTDKLSGQYDSRVYCVQYRESDFDFISRLMEEEGIYYYFEDSSSGEKMVLCDSVSAHNPVKGGPTFDFEFMDSNFRRDKDHIFDWSSAEYVTPGKVTLEDYDFERPKASLTTVKRLQNRKHSHISKEIYDYPGHIRAKGAGEKITRVRMEAQAAQHQLWKGVGNIVEMGCGQTFKLKNHPRVKEKKDFLIVAATHYLQIENEEKAEGEKDSLVDKRMAFDPDNKDRHRIVFECVPKDTPYRAPITTPWPDISGLHTAIVTGPSGEEIHTDKYGRIKVQFHWDREGQADENTTCWVRCVMPWTGKKWGMFSIPRIGQEVVVQFEEGDPDRPLCTGMLYNADTMPPYELPGNKTQSGIVTRSSKSGAADTFNELVFEDKKDAEFVRLQSEKDYQETIKNNAKITIGLEKSDPGDLTQTVHHTQTEIVKTGDLIVKVEKGNEKREIATDQTEKIGANREQDIGSNSKVTIGSNSELTIKSNSKVDVGSNLEVKVGSNIKEKAGSKITIEAGTEITLKVGASMIKMNNLSIELKSTNIKIDGKMVDVKGLKTSVSGNALLTLKGGMTMIN